MKIAVGSWNPEKSRGVYYAFKAMFSAERQVDVFRKSLKSGVARQPIGFDETLMGSINRASRALKLKEDVDYAVGVESGLILDKKTNCYQSIDYTTVINPDRIQKSSYWLGDIFSEELTALINQNASLRKAVLELSNQGKMDLDGHLKLRIGWTKNAVQNALRMFQSQFRVR